MPTAPVELLGANHFEAFAVDIDDLDGIIRFQMPAQLGDINIHRASVEIVWISPNALQSKGALEQSIFMLGKEEKQLIFLCRQALFSTLSSQFLSIVIEFK